MTILKGLLLVAGTYGGSLALWFVWLLVGAGVAGRSTGSRAGTGMFGTMLATAVTFLAGIALVYWGLGRLGTSQGNRVGVTLVYGLLACVTVVVLAFMTLIGFNR